MMIEAFSTVNGLNISFTHTPDQSDINALFKGYKHLNRHSVMLLQLAYSELHTDVSI